MREQEFRARDKKVQKMTRDGLVEENRTRKTTARISNREADTAFLDAKETSDGEGISEEPETTLGQRGTMRDAGDKPVLQSRAGREAKNAETPRDRSRRRAYRRGRGEEESNPLAERNAGDGESEPHRGTRSEAVGEKKRVRLRYLPEELPSGMMQTKREEMLDAESIGQSSYRQSRRQGEEKGVREREKIPSRTPLKRRYAQEKRKREGRLQFEQQEKRGRSVREGSGMSGRVFSEAARRWSHQKAEEAEEDNLGVETVHKTERIVGAGVGRIAGQRGKRMRENPYRYFTRTEHRLQKSGAGTEYRKMMQEEQKLQKKVLAKWMQKRRIRQKYAAAARESAKGAAHTANVLHKSGQVVRAAAKAVPKKTVIGMVVAGVLFVAMSGALFTSSGAMLAGIQSAVIATCYVADEEPINQSDLSYSEMETDLQLSINKTEEDYPGYDEYVYNVGEISHNPYELLGYLSAVYDDFTFAQVEAELERLFALQYRLSREEIVETRTRVNEDGEEEEYEWRLLKTTLTVRPLSEIINASLAPGDQTDRYGVYMQTCGNRQCYGNPFAFSWIPRVTSTYGYRVHPISGDKNLHRGIDIGMPEGTPIMAVQDGRVVSAGYQGDYGLCVVIEDDKGYQSKYAHCARIYVSAGQEVERGTRIAEVGNTGSSTGAHLHLEVLHNGAYLNPYFFVDSGGDGYQPDGTTAGSPEFSGHPGAPMGDGSFAAMLVEAEKYLGYPYVWGGSSPPTFDCSGYVSWVINQSGAGSVGRQTAQGLYNLCTPISKNDLKPGDLVFFTGTYSSPNPVTHVGIYVGGGRMIHAGDPISYAYINSSYWTAHFYSGGRLS